MILKSLFSRKTVKKAEQIITRKTIPAQIIKERIKLGARIFESENMRIKGDLNLSDIPVLWLNFQDAIIDGSLILSLTDQGRRWASVGVFDNINLIRTTINGDLIIKDSIMDGAFYFYDAKISDKDGEFKLLCDSAKEITKQELEHFKRIQRTHENNGHSNNQNKFKIIITLPPNSSPEMLKKLSLHFDRCEAGTAKVFVNINGAKLETPYCVENTADLKTQILAAIPEA
ncbi:MAG: hypothetical protein NTZ97_02205 [Candidatus Moranbacteria bacterium]|nr:hypothetical protein [Candidatus Moranbacteria bacterium]